MWRVSSTSSATWRWGSPTGKSVPLRYKDVELDCGFKLDLLVDDKVIVEVKSVSTLAAVHSAQVLTYLKLTGCPVALLINFNVPVLKNGIRRVLNNTLID